MDQITNYISDAATGNDPVGSIIMGVAVAAFLFFIVAKIRKTTVKDQWKELFGSKKDED